MTSFVKGVLGWVQVADKIQYWRKGEPSRPGLEKSMPPALYFGLDAPGYCNG